ncbi:MAG: PDZ domain-containing protein [Candidatus Marinimicrobia bacterium]|nr:PDZ domain-containing protein [Candidatus Neomarinimicrobiota bacterium]
MRYMLSILLLFAFGFGQKTITTKITTGDEIIAKVIKEIKDDKIIFNITVDGKTEKYEVDLDDDETIAKINEKLERYNLDEFALDRYDCEHALKTKCDKNTIVLKSKDGCDKKNVKIIKKHKMMDEKTGFLGVQIQDLSEQLSGYFKVKDGNGVLVSEVVKDSPAEKAGLKAGDIITKVDDKDIENAGDLTMTVRGYEPEAKVSVSVIRDGKKKNLEAILGESENNFMYKFGNLGEMGDKHKMILKMHPENLDEFEFHEFKFDKEEFKNQMDEMRKELSIMKEELKKLREEN